MATVRTKFTFRGLMAPVFTPFDDFGNVKLKQIPAYSDYLVKHGIKGVLVNGTTGEGVSMTVDERVEVFHAWMSAYGSLGHTVMVQVGGTNAADVQVLARDAESAGASAILCLADLFFRPSTVDELIRYLKMVSKNAPTTPLLYYHIPSFTGINLDVSELLRRRSEVPTLVGIKFTDVDLVMGNKCLKASGESPVFLGCDSLLLPALVHGFDSAIGTTINLFPALNSSIIEHFKEGNLLEASQKQRKLNGMIDEITAKGSWVSSMKAAMRKVTPIDVGPVREPLVNVRPEEIELVINDT